MLIGSEQCNGYSIRRRGVGIVLKLLAYMESIDPAGKGPNPTMIWALREFTKIRNPEWFVRFNRMEAAVILESILKVNVPKSNGSKSGSKAVDYEEMAANIVDLLASEYGWTEDHILQNIDLHTFEKLSEAIKKRRDAEHMDAGVSQILAYHDPQQAYKRLQKSQGIETISRDEALKRAKKAAEEKRKQKAG